jgi:hypothetical protein
MIVVLCCSKIVNSHCQLLASAVDSVRLPSSPRAQDIRKSGAILEVMQLPTVTAKQPERNTKHRTDHAWCRLKLCELVD